MFSRRKTQWVLSLALVSTTLGVQADVLHLKNGDRLSGEVDSIVGGKVVLKTEFAGTLTVKQDAIAHLESDKTFELRRNGSDSIKGQFAVTDNAQEFRVEGGGLETIDLAGIASARQNNLGLKDLGSDWANRFDVGVSISTGNTDTENQNYLLESILKRGRSEHKITGKFESQKDDSVKTKEILDTAYRYRRFFTEKWYGTGSLTYFQDKLKDIDSRYTVGAGAGYQFWDNSLGALSTDLGVSYIAEDLAGDTEENPALRWGLDYNRFLWSKQLEYFYTHTTLFIPQSNRGTVYNGSTGLRMKVTDMITANLRVDAAIETEPAEDRDKTDLTYVLGVGVVF